MITRREGASRRRSLHLECLETRNLLSGGHVAHLHGGFRSTTLGRLSDVGSVHAGLSRLNQRDIQSILNRAEATARRTASADGLRSNTDPSIGPVVINSTKMHIAVVDRSGRVLGFRSMADAWVGSEDIAIAKARTAAFFSSRENALTSRTIGLLSQAHDPNGAGGAGPLWGIGNSNQVGITGGPHLRNGIITFPGWIPLYKNGQLVGAIGVSGDGVDQDEFVAFGGATGFEPGPNIVKLNVAVHRCCVSAVKDVA
jgi:uncharacterized protein GlcG (DUF336 family)